MKVSEATAIIGGKERREGYCVTFEVRDRGMLVGDHFPDVRAGEPGIASEEEAWGLAAAFAHVKQKRDVVNVYVIRASDFTPVPSYRTRMLNVHPPPTRVSGASA